MQLDFPYGFDGRERTAEASESDHLRDMIEQLLFTQPGERVNRPAFGSGLMQLVFAAPSPEVVATAEFLIRGALQQFLSDRISVTDLRVETVESTLEIAIDYIVLADNELARAEFSSEIPR